MNATTTTITNNSDSANSSLSMETLVIRITPAWKRELEAQKQDHAREGRVVSISEIAREHLGPFLKASIAARQEKAALAE